MFSGQSLLWIKMCDDGWMRDVWGFGCKIEGARIWSIGRKLPISPCEIKGMHQISRIMDWWGRAITSPLFSSALWSILCSYNLRKVYGGISFYINIPSELHSCSHIIKYEWSVWDCWYELLLEDKPTLMLFNPWLISDMTTARCVPVEFLWLK